MDAIVKILVCEKTSHCCEDLKKFINKNKVNANIDCKAEIFSKDEENYHVYIIDSKIKNFMPTIASINNKNCEALILVQGELTLEAVKEASAYIDGFYDNKGLERLITFSKSLISNCDKLNRIHSQIKTMEFNVTKANKIKQDFDALQQKALSFGIN